MAFEVGRHIIGFEVQKVLAAVDWFSRENARHNAPIAVAGYGEGGLLAFYSAAIDPRIHAAAVSGYFQPREELSLLREHLTRGEGISTRPSQNGEKYAESGENVAE